MELLTAALDAPSGRHVEFVLNNDHDRWAMERSVTTPNMAVVIASTEEISYIP